MEGPPLGPGWEDITWPDQVAPRGRKVSSTRKIKPENLNHGADGLWVVVCPPRVVVDSIVRYPGWWFPGSWYWRQVLEVRVHVVL